MIPRRERGGGCTVQRFTSEVRGNSSMLCVFSYERTLFFFKGHLFEMKYRTKRECEIK